ncbi:hypothetical protein [Xanthomonas arboricola]|uniref:hypothetical protein n=1 Tax=Xanthomonas arboricola TaxID=56448 RepID=UPI0013967CEC|nr:hypothetical protein [Xanthomonas arboricola]
MSEGFGKRLRSQKRQRFGIVRRGAADAGHAGLSCRVDVAASRMRRRFCKLGNRESGIGNRASICDACITRVRDSVWTLMVLAKRATLAAHRSASER